MSICDIPPAVASDWPAIATALATVVLGAFTAWMAYETRRLARITQQSTLFDREPFLGAAGLQIGIVPAPSPIPSAPGAPPPPPGVSGIRVGIHLLNAGRVPIIYRLKNIGVVFAGRTPSSSEFVSRGGRILPGRADTFFHSAFSFEAVTAFPAVGQLLCEFEYWAEGTTDIRLLTTTYQYTIAGAAAGSSVEWVIVDPGMARPPSIASVPRASGAA